MILNVHQDKTDSHVMSIANQFVAKNERRLAIFGKFPKWDCSSLYKNSLYKVTLSTLSFLIVDARRLRFNSRKVLCVAAKKNSESLIRHSYECTKNSITIAKDSVSAISSVCLQLRIYKKFPYESPIPSVSAIRKERVGSYSSLVL